MTIRARVATKIPARLIGDGVCEVFYENGVYRVLVPSLSVSDFPIFTINFKGLVPPPLLSHTNKFLATDGVWREPIGAGTPLVDDAVNPPHLNADTEIQRVAFRDRLNFVSRDGDTMTGSLTLTGASPILFMNKDTDAGVIQTYIRTGGVDRWLWRYSHSDEEDVGNVGSTFILFACTDGGAPTKIAMMIRRDTGLITILGPPVDPGHAANKDYVDNSVVIAKAYADANKVAKSGDSMSGALTINALSGRQLAVYNYAGVSSTGGGSGLFGQNVYCDLGTGGNFKNLTTHASVGWTGLSLFGGGLNLYGATGATTADGVVTLGTPKFTVSTGGNVTVTGDIAVAVNATVAGTITTAALSVTGATTMSGLLTVSSLGVKAGASVLSNLNAAQDIGYLGGGTQYGLSFRPLTDNTSPCVFVNAADNIVGHIQQTTTGVTYETGSDGRLKQDLRSFDGGHIVDSTEVYDFAWKSTGARDYGIVAQQAVGVYPQAVTHLEDKDWWGIDYSKYVPVLLQELKALRARVAVLEAQNGA